MRQTETLIYDNPADAKDAFNYLDRLIEPEDNIGLDNANNVLTITATERELIGLQALLAKVDL
ncbi:hypothetical protein ES703_29950 [subsurface metagenome]